MRITDFFALIAKPLAFVLIVISIGTVAGTYYQPSAHTMRWVMRHLNLCTELNIAAWTESILFLLCGLSFVPLGWGRSKELEMPPTIRYTSMLAAVGCCFLAVDEAFCVHEIVCHIMDQAMGRLGTDLPEGSPSNTWVLLYAPPALIALALVVHSHWREIGKITVSAKLQQRARQCLIAALIAGPCVLLSEVLGNKLWDPDSSQLMPRIEELFEVAVLAALIATNTLIAKGHDL